MNQMKHLKNGRIKQIRDDIMAKDKKCVYCGCDEELFLTTEHTIPKCRGGRNTPDNVQWNCWLCNQLKGGLTHKEYLAYRKYMRSLKELRKIAVIYPDGGFEIKFMQKGHPLNVGD